MSDVRIASLNAQIDELAEKIVELKRRRDELNLCRPFTVSSEAVTDDEKLMVRNLRIAPTGLNKRRARVDVTRAEDGIVTCAISIDLDEEKLDLLIVKLQKWKEIYKEYIDVDREG